MQTSINPNIMTLMILFRRMLGLPIKCRAVLDRTCWREGAILGVAHS